MYLKIFLVIFTISNLISLDAQSKTSKEGIIVKVLTNKKIVTSNTEAHIIEGLYKYTFTEDEFINLTSFNELLYDSEYADIEELDACYVGDQSRALKVIKLAYLKNEGVINSYSSSRGSIAGGLQTIKLLQPRSIKIDNFGTITVDSITYVTYSNGLKSMGSTDIYFSKCSEK